MPFLLKVHRWFGHGLKMDVHVAWIISTDNFCHFFRKLNLLRPFFGRYYYQSEKIVSTFFAQLILQFYACFGHGLNMCMWFGYNRQIIFVTLSASCFSVIFQAFLLSKCIDRGYLVRATRLTILSSFR